MRAFLTAFAILLVGGALAESVPWGAARRPGSPDVPLDMRDFSNAAALVDSDVPEGTTDIVFSNSVSIGCIALSGRSLRFSAAKEGVVLSTACVTNAFLLRDGSWTFDGLSFKGPGALPAKARYHGGAIDCRESSLTVTNCTFEKLAARFGGGAIGARLMTGDVAISDSKFTDNVCGPKNGTGGAIYVSAREDGRTLHVSGSTFTANVAQSGGAVTTVCTTDDGEHPMAIDIVACTFDRNVADYNGGAVFAGSDTIVSNSLFLANGAGVQGGALCVGGPDVASSADVRIESGTVFRGNQATNDSATVWTCGGAVALVDDGGQQSIVGRYVIFEDNVALSPAGGFGGAVFTGEGASADVLYGRFLDNRADVGGGGVFSAGDRLEISTSVFSNNLVSADSGGYGGAISVEKSKLVVKNTTVRYSNLGAVDVYGAEAEIVNSVIVDNGEMMPDVQIGGAGASLKIDFSAFGRLVATDVESQGKVTQSDCLPDMDASIYRGGSLYLAMAGTNPAAVKGLPQSEEDHLKVRYGYDGRGYAMGAFECPVPSYRITYDLNDDGGEVDNRAVNNPTNRYGFFADELPVAIYPPTRPCYEFLGWKEGGTYYWAKDGFPEIPLGASRAYAFTALWREKEKPFDTIHYVFDPGESESDHEVVNNPNNPHHYVMSDTAFALYPPTRPGKELDGWQWRRQGGEFVVLPESVIPEGTSGDIWLRPVWTDAYTIEYDLSGGRNHPQNPIGYSKKTLPLRVSTDPFASATPGKVFEPTRDGYEFVGWTWKLKAGSAWSPFSDESPIPAGTTGDLVLRAAWSPIQNAIEYVLAGGENDPSNPTSYTVETEFPLVLKPATRAGLVFDGWQIRNFATQTWDPLEGGVLPVGTTGYVWVKATWTDKPTISVEELTWYHNRSDGRYYPKIVLKVDAGDASVVTGITFTCSNGVSFEMPAAKLAVLNELSVGGTVTNGVEHFVPYSNSEAGYGFVPPTERLFEGFVDAQRPDPASLSVSVSGVFRTVSGEVSLNVPVRLASARRKSVRLLSAWVPVPAQFTDFQVGERLTGRTEVPAGAAVVLYGCETLGGEWVKVATLSVGTDGTFSTTVPEGLHFFRLMAEVRR